MTSDVYGLDEMGTGGWSENVEDQLLAVDRQIGTTTLVDRDRLFAWRARVANAMKHVRFLSFVDPGVPLPLPASLEAKLSALSAEASRPGWDGERGLPVEHSAWESARAILRRLPDDLLRGPALHVSMSGDGFVHLTVSLSERGSATVEVGHGKFYWTWMRGMDEGDTADLSSLTEAASKLRKFAAG